MNFLRMYFPSCSSIKAIVDFCVAIKFLIRLKRPLNLTPELRTLQQNLIKEGYKLHAIELAMEKSLYDRPYTRRRGSSGFIGEDKSNESNIQTSDEQVTWIRNLLSASRSLLSEFRDEELILDALLLSDNDVEKAQKMLNVAQQRDR